MANKYGVYSVRDSKSESFALPFFQVNKAVALRSFAGAVNNPQTGMGQHPNDYALFELGTWDDTTGRMEAHDQPIHLGNAFEFVEKAA